MGMHAEVSWLPGKLRRYSQLDWDEREEEGWLVKEAPRSLESTHSKMSAGDQQRQGRERPDSSRQEVEERRLHHRLAQGSPEQPCWGAALCESAAERNAAKHFYLPLQRAEEEAEVGEAWSLQTRLAGLHSPHWDAEEGAAQAAPANHFGAAGAAHRDPATPVGDVPVAREGRLVEGEEVEHAGC